MEIDLKSYASVNTDNKVGIDGELYQKSSVDWSISGPKEEVKKSNQKVILFCKIQNLDSYLTDPLEFYK